MIQIQQEHQKAFPDTSALDEDTIAMIHRLAAFLQNHCDQHLTLETLGKIFYTNKNKRLHRLSRIRDNTGYTES